MGGIGDGQNAHILSGHRKKGAETGSEQQGSEGVPLEP